MGYAVSAAGAGISAHAGLSNVASTPRLQALSPGPLDETVRNNLKSLVETFVDDNGPTGHYDTYFNWRSENLPDYRNIYTIFSEALDAASQDLSGQVFSEADPSVRQIILQYALEMPDSESALTAPKKRETLDFTEDLQLDEQLWLSFDQFIIGEMINVFLQTNAWIMLGYDAWPGQPRQLAAYPLPVESTP